MINKFLRRLLNTKYQILATLIFIVFGLLLTPRVVFAQTDEVRCQECMNKGNRPTECPSCPQYQNLMRQLQGTWTVPSAEQFDQTVWGEANPPTSLDTYLVAVFSRMMHITRNAVSGTTVTVQTPQGPVKQQQGGAISILAGLTGTLYTTPPASSVEYLADIGQSLGLVKPAYAQGIGFGAFSPVLSLWKTFRDIAYLGFVVIFVIVGFMIMFRKRIDPRTVVTIQEALPRIVITLILITFSYAIAGLIIDGAHLATVITANLFAGKFIALGNTGVAGVSAAEKVTKLLNTDIFHLVNPLRDVGDLVNPFSDTSFSMIPSSVEGKRIGALVGLGVGLVFWIMGFFVMFKIFFALIGPYVSIVLSVIFAPIMLLLGALPGSQASALNWLKGFIANVAVFPVTFIMLVLAAIFKSGPLLCKPYGGWQLIQDKLIFGPADWATKCEPIGTTLWMAPGIGNWGPLVGQLIAFGILFAIPGVAEIVKESLQVKPGIAQQIIGQEVKGGLGRIPLIGSFLPK